MRVLFDNCTSPAFATALDGFISHFGHRAFHIKDVPGLPDGRHTPDLVWIKHLQSQPQEWIFVSGDRRLLVNRAERAALRTAALHGFVLASGYQSTPLHQVAAMILWRWPDMLAITQLVAPPSIHEIPIRRQTRMRPLPL